jgi:hypothetical protein
VIDTVLNKTAKSEDLISMIEKQKIGVEFADRLYNIIFINTVTVIKESSVVTDTMTAA